MAKKLYIDPAVLSQYCALLERTIHDMDSLLHDYEFEVMTTSSKLMPRELVFDAVPVVKKLKDVKKEAEMSLGIYANKVMP